MAKGIRFQTVVALAAAALALLTSGCADQKPAAQKPAAQRSILVHCGNSMRPPTEEIAHEFERATGIRVDFNYGGSEMLLPSIQVSRKGDVFVCHDPFGDLLKQSNLLQETAIAGQLAPVMVVARGNRLNLHSLEDLTRDGVRVGLLDARFSACGELVRNTLKAKNLNEAVRKNVRVEVRNHSDLATAILASQLDAALVWNFIGSQYAKDLEVVPAADVYPVTNVTLCSLTCAADAEGAAMFLKAASSPAGLQVYAKHGYSVPKTAAK